MPLKFILTLLIFCIHAKLYAQSEIAFFILSGEENANTLARAYLTPLGKSMVSNLGSGWFVGGKKTKSGHFNFMLVTTSAWVPTSDKSFDLNTIALKPNVHLKEATHHIVPTALGKNVSGAALEVSTKIPPTDEAIFLSDFNTPEGLGIPAIPLPLAQLHIGIIKETELMMRFLPRVGVSYEQASYTTYMWGVGLKHHLNQWFPALKANSLDITFAVAYARQNACGDLKRTQAWYWHHGQITMMTEQQKDPSWYDHQYIAIEVASYMFEWIVSKEFNALHLYTGLRYIQGKTYVDTPGIYPQRDIRSSDKAPYYEYFFHDAEKPIGVRMNTRQVGLTIGLQYSLGKFNLNTEGTFSTYKNLSAGIGFGL